jgi:predicted permease
VVSLNGRDFTVIGVFPQTVRSRMPSELSTSRPADFWVPLRLDETVAPRGLHFMSTLGRLKPGVSIDAARAQMSSHLTRLRGADTIPRHAVRIMPLEAQVIGDSQAMLKLLLGAVIMLLLIACANVANLLLARAAFRHREFAVRLALGASRTRIVSQLLAENVVRSLLGGALGIAIAYGTVWGIRKFLPLRLPRLDEVGIDARVLAFAFAASVVTGILFGLVPALSTARQSGSTLRGSGRGISGGLRAEHLRRSLIVAEIAMSFVLLAGAGLLMKSFVGLAQSTLGFEEARVVSSYVSLPSSRYRDSNEVRSFYRRMQAEIAAIPGVEGVAFTSDLPVQGGTNGGVNIDGRTYDDATRPIAEKRVVSTNYLQVMGAKLSSGRMFDDHDVAGAALPSVIINETFAKRHFPGENPIGRRVDFLWEVTGLQTIVGVVEDLREGSQTAGPLAAIYIPVDQRSSQGMFMVVRAQGDPRGLTGAIRARVATLDPLMPVAAPTPLTDTVAGGISRQRATTIILGTFAAIALLLAAIGLYGVISYSVTQRTQELGVRAALGAQASDLMQLVLRQGALFLAAGVVIGVAGALGLTRYIRAELYGVTPLDGQTYVIVALVLAATALLAIALPARRATRSDPLSVLRAE